MAAPVEETPEGSCGVYSSSSDATVGDVVWEEKVRSLKDIIASFRLPLVARVKSGDLSRLLPRSGADDNNIVQIHELRRRKIVFARRLQWEKRQHDYIVSGEQVEVPASFKGWFEVVPEDGRPVEYFDTVGAIASVKPRRFLVRTSTVGYQLSIEDGATCWMPHEIRPGEVLTTGMVYMDNNNNTNNKKGRSGAGNNKGFFKRLLKSSKSKSRPEQDLKYLQCFDMEGREVMIPLIMSGVFSPVGDALLANYDAVYELQDLIMAFGLPVNVQLIHASIKEKASCPQGVLKLLGSREEELVLVSRVAKNGLIADPGVEKVEVTLDKDLVLQRGMPRRKQSVHSTRPQPLTGDYLKDFGSGSLEAPPKDADSAGMQVALPKRAPKELKKSKSTGLLDILSVRRARHERARLKELRADDVFSRRIVRSDLSYEDFFNGLDGEGEDGETKAAPTTTPCGPGQASSESPYGSTTAARSSSIQTRDLPPIPVETPHSPVPSVGTSTNSSRDSLYEHLPPAPKPPTRALSEPTPGGQADEEEGEEDGYMVPTSVSAGPPSHVHIRRRPPTGPRHARYRKCRSELPTRGAVVTEGVPPDNLTDLRNVTNQQDIQERPYGTITALDWTGSTSQLYGYKVKDTRSAAPWPSDSLPQTRANDVLHGSLTRSSLENLDLETRSTHGSRYRSRSQGRNHQVDANATIRLHNLRKSQGALQELFQTSSLGDSQSLFSSSTHTNYPGAAIPDMTYHPEMRSYHALTVTSTGCGPWDAEGAENGHGTLTSPHLGPAFRVASNPYSQRPFTYIGYPDSESLYRKYPRALSMTGLSDSAYPKQGDDSAISVGSRGGEYVLHNDSEYSYNEYSDSLSCVTTRTGVEDNWRPPDDISGLSVQEVSRSLRYIGMKDRVVLRFSHEQIDGSMLCSLDKRLLKEGFPDLNALEIKKILDFVRGWRPKKK